MPTKLKSTAATSPTKGANANTIQVAGAEPQTQSEPEGSDNESPNRGRSRRRAKKASGGLCRMVRPAAAMPTATTLSSVLQPTSGIISMQDDSILHYDPLFHATFCSLYEDYSMENLSWSDFRVCPEVD